MAYRFQYLLLRRICRFFSLALFVISPFVSAKKLELDTEFFDIGISTGVISVQDFSSEFTLGVNATFRATENLFLNFNYFKADISTSIAEQFPGSNPFSNDRDYRHYNVLLGYNLFQGEIFKGKYAGLSSFYGVLGAGDTEFLEEASFTYVYGLGYRMAMTRRILLNFDLRQYRYDFATNDQFENAVTNSHFSVGLGWLF